MASGKRRKEKGREKTTRASETEKCSGTVLSPSCRKSEAEDLGLGFLSVFFSLRLGTLRELSPSRYSFSLQRKPCNLEKG